MLIEKNILVAQSNSVEKMFSSVNFAVAEIAHIKEQGKYTSVNEVFVNFNTEREGGLVWSNTRITPPPQDGL
jgi:hypothetical protein